MLIVDINKKSIIALYKISLEIDSNIKKYKKFYVIYIIIVIYICILKYKIK